MALTTEESEFIKKKLWPQQLLAGAVAKMYLASPDPRKLNKPLVPGSFLSRFPALSNNYWTDSGLYGGLILAHDASNGSYSFQMINLETLRPSFQYELYYNLDFIDCGNSLYAFEVDDCVIGFGFSSVEEGERFYDLVCQNCPTTKKGRNKLRQKNQTKRPAPGFRGILKGIIPKASPRIGGPQNIENVNHLELNADGTIDIEAVPKEWRQTFKMAGLKPKDLKDPKLVEAVVSMIETEEMALTYKEQDPQLSEMETSEIIENYELPEREEFQRYVAKEEAYNQQKAQYEEYQKQVKGLEKWEEQNEPFVSIKRHISEKQGTRLRPLPLPPRDTQISQVSQLRTNTPLPKVPGKEGNDDDGDEDDDDDDNEGTSKRRVSYITPLSSRQDGSGRTMGSGFTEGGASKGSGAKPRKRRPEDGRKPRKRRPDDTRGTRNGSEQKPRRKKTEGGKTPRRRKPGEPGKTPRRRKPSDGEALKRKPSAGGLSRKGSDAELNSEARKPKATPRTRKPADGGNARRTPHEKPSFNEVKPPTIMSQGDSEGEYFELPPPPPPPGLMQAPKLDAKPELPPPKPKSKAIKSSDLQAQLKNVKANATAIGKRLSQGVSKVMKKPQAPSFLQQISEGTIQLNETGLRQATTVRRVNKKIQSPDDRDDLVTKLALAINQRREALGSVSFYDDDDDDDDDWDID